MIYLRGEALMARVPPAGRVKLISSRIVLDSREKDTWERKRRLGSPEEFEDWQAAEFSVFRP